MDVREFQVERADLRKPHVQMNGDVVGRAKLERAFALHLPAWQAVSLMLVLTGAAFGGSLYGAAFPAAPRRHR